MKKESFWKRNKYLFQSIGWFSFALILVVWLVYDITKEEFNPDEYVCEEWIENCIELNGYEGDFDCDECLSYRKLTPTEKAIKSCNDNPREDDLCSCQEYKTELSCGGYPVSKTLNFKTQEELNEYVDSSMSRNDVCRFYPSRVLYYLKVKDYIKGFNKQEKDYMDGYGLNYTIINIIATNDYAPQEFRTKYCTSSTPKTPCQRGNEDWVEERTQVFDCIEWEENFTCESIGNIEWCSKSCLKEINSINKTTCRPKTEVEKLMDKDCDWLLQEMINSCGQYKGETRTVCKEEKQYYLDLKTSWRNKECVI